MVHEYNPVWRFFTGPEFKEAQLGTALIQEENSKTLLKWISDPCTFAVLQGDVGVGKTHIGLALFDYIFKKKSHNGVQYPSVFCYPEWKIFEIVSDSWSTPGKSEREEMEKLCAHEFLFIDDFGASISKMEWKDSVLFRIIDERSVKHKKTFLTTNLSLDQFADRFHPRLLDRIYNSNSHWILWEGTSKR